MEHDLRLSRSTRGAVRLAVLTAMLAFASPAWAGHGNGAPEVSPSSATGVTCAEYTGPVAFRSVGNATQTHSGSFNGSNYTMELAPTAGGGSDKRFTFVITTTSGPMVVARTVYAEGAAVGGNAYDYHHPTASAGAGMAHDDGLGNPNTSGPSDVTFCLDQLVASTLAVQLRSFSAAKNKGNVVLRWRTAAEIDTLGYNVYREVNGKRVRLNRSLIGCSGGQGKSYLWRGSTKAKGSSRYWLESVDIDGSRTWVASARLRRL